MTSTQQINQLTQVPDRRGRFGEFGGRFVPETLTRALDQLVDEYEAAKADPKFRAELDLLLDKISARGFGSLSDAEKRRLEDLSARLR